MAKACLQVTVRTPIDRLPVGRGFYQVEEDSLYVEIGIEDTRHRFFSYLESPLVRFDMDIEGRLLFIEISLPRRQWPVDLDLRLPGRPTAADIRWLDFRSPLPSCALSTRPDHSLVCLTFARTPEKHLFTFADNLVVACDTDYHVTRLWICDITDDLAGHSVASVRKALRHPKDL